MKEYILALDQGTTSSRTILFDNKGQICGTSQLETEQIFPKNGWVEQDPEEIYQTQYKTLIDVIENAKIEYKSIKAIGIANQRETIVVWSKKTGKPIYNAIVWQDVRTSDLCKDLINQGFGELIHQKTGLIIDSYFSASKIKWILDNVPKAKEQAESGDLLVGTIDTWLLWKLTNGKVHATDFSNASRTMLFNINSLEWDSELLKIFDIPAIILPEVKSSSSHFGDLVLKEYKVPITGVVGDQQAALFGQTCFDKGDVKNTYGTGCFLLMNTGEKPQFSKNGLLTTIAWGIGGKVFYALEGSVFIGGAAIQWLRDGLEIINSAEETEEMAKIVKEDNNVYVVPAFSGMGAPYWNMDARGAIFGLTQDTNKNHLIKATLEAIAYQSKDIIIAMEEDSKMKLSSLKVDGGASSNNYLMQFQSNILDANIERSKMIESTALGAAYIAGIGAGLWKMEEVLSNRIVEKRFVSTMDASQREKLYRKWKTAVQRSLDWEN